MSFPNPYQYHNNYEYVNHQPAPYDAESMRSQFSSYEHYDYPKESVLQSAEHGIVGPLEKSARDDASLSFGQDIPDNPQSMQGYPEFTPIAQRADVAFPCTTQSSYFSDTAAPIIEQRTGNNAAPTVEDQGDSSLANPGMSDPPVGQPEVQRQGGSSKSLANQAHNSPKTTNLSASRGGLKTRTTVHDRSKLVTKKQQRRTTNAPVPDAVKSYENSAAAISSNDQTDPLTQWYQMMSQYYSQFYPGYQLPQPPSMSAKPTSSEEPKPPIRQSDRAVKSTTAHIKQNNHVPTQLGYPARSGALAAVSTGTPGNFDYAAYYYQYYYEAAAAAAAQMWTGGQYYPGYDPAGRQTPKLFPTPHVRGGLTTPGILLQILPNRPSDGELARIELLDMSVLANDAVAEATKRAAESGSYMGNLARLTEFHLNRGPDDARDAYSSGASGLESPGRLSSLQAGAGGDDDGEEARACAAVAVAWDRTDHVFYPGPLSRSGTLKADVLVFLRDKLAEIQDRLPIDWESAGLLISYLEFMVKNNGNVQPSDLVRLLLEGHEPQTSDLRVRGVNNLSSGNSYSGISIPNGMIRSTRSYLNDSLASLPPSQVPSGRQSPQTGYGIPGSASSPGIAKAASETGGMGTTQALLRRAAAAVTSSGNSRQQEEDKMLDRFRELLMHGMPTKALEHACRSHLWGHAFVLAQRLGPALFQKVMDRFLTRAIPVSDPILTLYQLTAGELPQSVNAAAYGRGSDNGEWRPHLAMILASECAQPELIQTALERLGDNLLSRRLVYAAHLCYLLIGPLIKQDLIKCDQHQQQQHHYQQQQQPVYRLPDKIWLLGVTSSSNSTTGTDVSGPNAYGEGCAQNLHPLNASTEAIQLTEVYEYAMRLANQNYRLPQLLPFKLVYVTRLIDAGLLDKAYRYLTAIGQDLLLEANRYEAYANGPQSVSPTLYSMVSNCLRLIEPLQNHPELDGFELAAPSRVPMSLAGSLNAASFLPQLRELYDRMNRQLARAQYASVMCTPPKLSTDMIGSGETHTASEPVVQHQSPPDPRNLNTPVYADLRQHHQSLAQPSTPSSVIETSSTGPPVTAYAVPGRHSTTSQSYASGRSEPAAQSYGLSEPSGCRPQGELINTQPGMHTAPDRPDASARMSSSSAYGPSSQTAEPSGFNKPQSVPFDQRISFEQPSRPTGSNFDPNFGVVDSTGGVPNGPVHCSNLFGVFSPPGSQRDRDGLTLDGTNVPTGQMPMTATVPEQLQPNSSLFFTPIVSSYTESSGPDGPQVGTPGVFDYFAGLRSTEQQPGNRSRTVSGGSQSSTIGGYPHTRSRNSSGMGPSRRSSANYDRSVHMASQSHPGPPQTPKHMSPSHDLQQHPIKEESSHAHLSHQTPVRVSKEEKPDDEQGDAPGNAAQSKDGWFSGLFGRLKRNGAKSVHLPDDSKPSIVWDDERKEWVDVNNPDAGQTPPPPPPMMMPTQNTTPGPIPGASISPGGGGASSPPIGRGGSRSRYVNVLANQTAGPAAAKLDAPLPPPLPATASYGASPIMPPTTTAPLRHSLQSSEYNLRPAPVPQTKDVNNSSHFQMDGSTSGLMTCIQREWWPLLGISTPKLAVSGIAKGTSEASLLSYPTEMTTAIVSSSCVLTTGCFWRERSSAIRSGID